MGMPGACVVEMNENNSTMGIIELCDPRMELGSEQQFIEFWTNARLAIEKFLTVHRRGKGESAEQLIPHTSLTMHALSKYTE
jgi:hypothetical protein